MQKNRSISVLLSAGFVALIALPVALTTYVGGQRATVDLPNYHATHSGPEGTVTPVSERKAQAVREFKTTQV